MTRDEIEMLWIKALYESIEAGEKYSRYRFAALVAAAEREACARVCETIRTNGDMAECWLEIAAAAIRARSKP